MNRIERVSIALKPSVYSTFRALNNTVSHTLGEYVDNAVQSFLNNREVLKVHNPDYKLEIKIEIDWINKTITIHDNAAGIDSINYERAFEPAHIPIDASGLNEFGMGMKTASVWLADHWCVYSKALGETVERFTEFDLDKVIKEDKEELVVIEVPKPINEHYTKIVLSKLSNHAPTIGQMDKIRRHLSSIYRKFIRDDEVDIYVNGERLESPKYDILNAPFYKTPKSQDILWKKDIDFEMGEYKAKGFIAILDKIQNNANGLVLLRRGRVIVGGGDDRYFPANLFGQSGNFRYKRLFGELELEGFDVTFNKNGFRDEEDLYAFMDALKDELKASDFNLLGQADNFRQRSKEECTEIAKKITHKLKKETKPRQLTKQLQEVEDKINDKDYLTQNEEIIQKAESIDKHVESFELGDVSYTLYIELVTETSSDSLYSVSLVNNMELGFAKSKKIICKINLVHPFFTRFDLFKIGNNYQPIIAIFKSLALAEIMAINRGSTYVSNVRLLFNQYILH